SEIAKDSPVSLDYLCDECREHFEQVKALLDQAGIEYTVNPRIVRGLDYYSKTVFEFIHEAAGAQGTVCGGGRYDGLVEMLGGSPMPGIGFGMGLERLLDVAVTEGVAFPEPPRADIFICAADDAARATVRGLVFALQAKGIAAQYDLNARSLKAQLKFANKTGAKFSLVLGENEINSKKGELKNMTDGCTIPVDIDPARLAAALQR
ncbi:MAG: histidine--tRNA ligase, partial [Ruminococcaceae bacterium]|nr:histidine--tRNA ligase [Oscillospiraceae bacterium]